MPFYCLLSNKPINLDAIKQSRYAAMLFENNYNSYENGGYHFLFNHYNKDHFVEEADKTTFYFGHIRHESYIWDWKGDNETFLKQVTADLATLPGADFKEKYNGVYTIVQASAAGIKMLNTFSGVHQLFYHNHNGLIAVSNSIYCLQAQAHQPIHLPGFYQQTCNYFQFVMGRKTHLQDVYKLEPNEVVQLQGDKTAIERIPFIPHKTAFTTKEQYGKWVWEQYDKSVRLFAGKNLDVTMCLSGGLDSRTIFVTLQQYAKPAVVTHGPPEGYEPMVAEKVANAYGVPFYHANTVHTTIPTRDDLEAFHVHNGGQIPQYIAITKTIVQNNLPTTVVLGDLFEMMDGRHTDIADNRSTKMKYSLNKLLGGTTKFTEITDESFKTWADKKVEENMAMLLGHAKSILNKVWSDRLLNDQALQDEIRSDIQDFINDFKNNKVGTIDNLSETLGWYWLGRQLYVDQSFSFMGKAEGYTLLANDNFMKTIMGTPLEYRFQKGIFMEIYKNEQFKKAGKLGTPQVPHVAATAPTLFKEVSLLTRYIIDKRLMKASMRKTGNVRSRHSRLLNDKHEYEDPKAEQNVRSWYNGSIYNTDSIMNRFNLRKTGQAYPISSSDLILFARAEQRITETSKLEKE